MGLRRPRGSVTMARFAEPDPTMTTPVPRRVAAALLTISTLAGCGPGSGQTPGPAATTRHDSATRADSTGDEASGVDKPNVEPNAEPNAEPAAAGKPPTREAPTAAFDLQRFVDAQDRVVRAPATTVYEVAVAELEAGAKREHWMWFVFPQLAGLAPNPSPMSRRYAIVSLAEARAYLADPVLGRRLADCARLLLAQPAWGAAAIFPAVDVAKLQSSMTLFSIAAGGDANPFREVLVHLFGGQVDAATVKLLARPGH